MWSISFMSGEGAKAEYPCHKRKHQDDLSLFKNQHYFYSPSHTSPHYVGFLGPKKVQSVSSPPSHHSRLPLFPTSIAFSITVGSTLPLRRELFQVQRKSEAPKKTCESQHTTDAAEVARRSRNLRASRTSTEGEQKVVVLNRLGSGSRIP